MTLTTKITTAWFYKAIVALMTLIVLLLGVASIFVTYGFPQDFGEYLIRAANSELLHAFLCAMVLGTTLLALINNISLDNCRRIRLVCAFITFAIGLFWCLLTNVSPHDDSLILFQIAEGYVNNSFETTPYYYLDRYPFQCGYLLYLCAVGSIFGTKNYIAFRLLNIICAALIVIVVSKITEQISNNKKAGSIAAILTTTFLPLSFISTLMYGNIPSLFLCLFACWQALLIKNKKWHHTTCNVILMSASLFFALWFKLNASIFFIAIGMWFTIMAVNEKKFLDLFPVLLVILIYFFSSASAKFLTTSLLGEIPLSGIPLSSHLAMGLQEGSRAPGWYNNYIWDVWTNCNGNVNAISASNAEIITERLSHFATNPKDAIHFFGKKTLTQWCEPTFQSLWTTFCAPTDVFNDPENPLNSLNADLLRAFRDGKARTCYELYCDSFQTLIYVSGFFGLIKQLKKLNCACLLIAIVFIGAFVYFTLFEAKSMYVLPYFVLLIPFAANSLFDFLEHLT